MIFKKGSSQHNALYYLTYCFNVTDGLFYSVILHLQRQNYTIRLSKPTYGNIMQCLPIK